MLKVTSREYKVMLRPEFFRDPEADLLSFLDAVKETAKRRGEKISGERKSPENRIVRFLDTPDFTVRKNGLVLRHRAIVNSEKTQLTLKCRSADRYLAQGANLASHSDVEAKEKFEEDISPVFRNRFSHSVKLTQKNVQPDSLNTIKKAARLFPGLGALAQDGRICSPKTPLQAVNAFVACESVHKGYKLTLADTKATLAVIFWTKEGNSHPIVAEFSFRYRDEKEKYSAEQALTAQRLFLDFQELHWCNPESLTKTQFVYGKSTPLLV